MEYTFETLYNARSMAVMAKTLRKTVRKKRSIRSLIYCILVIGLAFGLLAVNRFVLDAKTGITLLVVLVLLLVFVFQDRINGFIAAKRLLPGTETVTAVFTQDGFNTTATAGQSIWKYETILQIVETEDYFVLIYSNSHAQMYDKRSLQGGTAQEFKSFLETVTGKTVTKIK